MKKFIITLLIVFSASVFAADVSVSTIGSYGVDLDSSNSQMLSLGKTYSIASYMAGKSKITGVIRWEKLAANLGGAAALDYLYIDTPVALGSLRLGEQKLGMGNYGMGVPQTTPFLTAVCLKANGVALSTELVGLPTKVFFANNLFVADQQGTAGDGKGSISALVDTKMGSTIGVIYSSDTSADVKGTSLYADFVTDLMGVNVQLQAFYDLSDDALNAAVSDFYSATNALLGNKVKFSGARQLVNVAFDTKIEGIGTLYGFYLQNLNKANDTVLKIRYAVGLEFPVSDQMNLVVEYGETDETTNGKTQQAKAALEFAL